MSKTLQDIITSISGAQSGAGKTDKIPAGEARFRAKHVVMKFPDRAGNTDDVFNGSIVRKDKSKAGSYESPEDLIVYEENLNEITKKAARSYARKAEGQLDDLNDIVDDPAALNRAKKTAQRLIKNRTTGLNRAYKKISTPIKEEVEEINEDYRDQQIGYLSRAQQIVKEMAELVDDIIETVRSDKRISFYDGKYVYRQLEDLRDSLENNRDSVCNQAERLAQLRVNEQVEETLTETFRPGKLKLADGTAVKLTEQQATLLNRLEQKMSSHNGDAMIAIATKSKSDLADILKFAKETV